MSELRTAVAFVFQRAGRRELTDQQIRHQVSMDLRWFEPRQARTFVERARERGYLEEGDEGLRPTFDPSEVEVPLGFEPDLTERTSPLTPVLDRITDAGGSREDAVAAINREQARFDDLLDPVVAGFLVARMRGIDVDDLIRDYLDAGG